MTLQERARELYDALELRQRPDGKKYYCLKEGSPPWMTDLVRRAHGDRLPNDYVYEAIAEAAAVLADADPNADIDELQDALAEIEADCYTGELTAWLNDSAYNVYYLSEALDEDPGIRDGFQLLARAQYLFKQEVVSVLLDELAEVTDGA